MSKHLDRYYPRVERQAIRIGSRVMDCVVGLPPANMPIDSNAVQLNTGFDSGPTMFLPYGAGLNALGYATIIVSPHTPGTHNHEDVIHISEKIMEGELGFFPNQLSYGTHSFGTRDTIRGLAEFAEEELLQSVNNIVAISPVGYRGVQGVVGGAKTLLHDVLSLPSRRHIIGLATEAFGYTVRAGVNYPSIIREVRGCNLIEPTKEIIARGIGVGAVLGLYDNLILHGPALEGLHEAGVEAIESVSTDHLGVLLQAKETLEAGLRVRDALDKARSERESKKSA